MNSYGFCFFRAMKEFFHRRCIRGLTSGEARLQPAGSCRRKDVVLVKAQSGQQIMVAAQIWAHAEVSGFPVSLVNCFRPLPAGNSSSVSEWQVDHQPELVATEDILAACIHTPVPRQGKISVLVPWRFRSWARGWP